MRALGPGSVSSLLKIVLDVVYGLMLFVVGILVIAAIGALLFKIDPAIIKQMSINGMLGERLSQGPIIALLLIGADRFSENLVVSGLLFTSFTYLLLLIRDLDNPFQYNGKSCVDVDLSLVRTVRDRLQQSMVLTSSPLPT